MENKKSVIERITKAIKNEKTIARHILSYHWISGSSTIVYPIGMWHDDVEIQVDIDRNVFAKAIDRIIKNNPDLFKGGCFWRTDGSCPSHVTLFYTPQVEKEMA